MLAGSETSSSKTLREKIYFDSKIIRGILQLKQLTAAVIS